ncbi:MAG TPA: rubrerythrin [Bdellovibrionales bacterium]|nr:MAG: rubrerythrin [Bdellovibrionales bacterium GWB1_52_6]OFZ05707.1 MAG: rubrerythrin [Bdellovibrionales bacterium GWA1_52_35]OFZ40656.1 MAG: rubrerythrin [Bdellovibrionales bacterium GWC1_52_8]HAR44470.1 rubrerythrin [Bdellovibrionales bacterium]HCM40356.1 rubrerythrin [Bdellovibrionales bacterium]
MPTTMENLKVAFAGESQANRKYLAYAEKAEKDGYPTVARLFRAAAEAETIHALGHFKAMGGVNSTLENLKDAVNGETYEYTEMYPPMLEQARLENHKGKTMISFAEQAERVHAELYKQALAAVEAGHDLKNAEIYICPVCGDIHIGEPNANCPICGVKPDKYRKV